MIKFYLVLLATIVVGLASWVFAAPLISAPRTDLVLAGFVLVAGAVAAEVALFWVLLKLGKRAFLSGRDKVKKLFGGEG